MRITGLISEPPLSYQISEEDKDMITSGQDSRPGEPRSRISDHQREGSLRMNSFKDFPRISLKTAYWKIMKFS